MRIEPVMVVSVYLFEVLAISMAAALAILAIWALARFLLARFLRWAPAAGSPRSNSFHPSAH